MITALGKTALKPADMLIYTRNTHTEAHTVPKVRGMLSAISPVFALPYLRSQRYAEVSY